MNYSCIISLFPGTLVSNSFRFYKDLFIYQVVQTCASHFKFRGLYAFKVEKTKKTTMDTKSLQSIRNNVNTSNGKATSRQGHGPIKCVIGSLDTCYTPKCYLKDIEHVLHPHPPKWPHPHAKQEKFSVENFKVFDFGSTWMSLFSRLFCLFG